MPRSTSAVTEGTQPLEDPILDEMTEAMGRYFEGFGFRRHLGRLWMTLYLSLEPMTQRQLQERLGLSAGMVSTLLRELSDWNAVHVRTLPSSRQTWYQAETDLLAYVARILRRRDMTHVQELDRSTTRAIDALEARVRAGGVEEVILATNPTVAGDGTALHITSLLEGLGVKLTRLARGLPSGGQIEYASKSILTDAITERRDV